MSKRNPYEVLGVLVNASEDEIRSAYLRRSKETHPDQGGTAEAFREVKEAYDLLRDTGRRARFDATGRDLDVPTAKQFVVMAWSKVMAEGWYSGVDFVAEARKKLADLIANQKALAKNHDDDRQRFERIVKRLERKAGAEPILEEFMQTLLDPVLTELCKCRLMIERAQEAIELLKSYAWSVPKEIESKPARADAGQAVTPNRCRAARDGECNWSGCPQTRDCEPEKTGRSCPLHLDEEEDEVPQRRRRKGA